MITYGFIWHVVRQPFKAKPEYHVIIISMQSVHYLCCHGSCHISVKHGAVVRGLKYMITSFKTDAVLGKQVNRQQLMKFFPVRCIPRINNISILVTFVSHINRIIEIFFAPKMEDNTFLILLWNELQGIWDSAAFTYKSEIIFVTVFYIDSFVIDPFFKRIGFLPTLDPQTPHRIFSESFLLYCHGILIG